jgi:hypothetical protein
MEFPSSSQIVTSRLSVLLIERDEIQFFNFIMSCLFTSDSQEGLCSMQLVMPSRRVLN